MANEIHKYGTDDSWHGKIEEGGEFPPEDDRYHLYIGLFCPFAHRVNLIRHLSHLTTTLPISIVRPYPKGEPGWRFDSDDSYPNATPDHLFNSRFIHQLYFKDDPAYAGKYSVPLLWDKKTNKIVCNESLEMVDWLPGAFPSHTPLHLYPDSLASPIKSTTPWLTANLNSGVYRAGFATSQSAYDAAVPFVFAALNLLEQLAHSHNGPYILGSQLTALDILAYPTIVRFDAIYVQHFKTNLGTIRHDYPVLNNWLKRLYWGEEKGWKESTDFLHIKENYTKSHADINPHSITPMGPFPDVEDGYEEDWSKLKPGSVRHPKVLEAMKELQDKYKL